MLCPVDVQVNLVEPGPTQNHANTSDVYLQKSVSTAWNIFKMIPDLDYCDITLVDLQKVTSHCQKFFWNVVVSRDLVAPD